MIRLLFTGFFILTGAIISNLFAPKIQLKTWYDFLQGMLESLSFWNQVSFKDLVWLFYLSIAFRIECPSRKHFLP
jgi:hypothetical protein